MIGKIYTSVTPFYDVAKGTNSFKCRPVLIISDARNNDYTVLPISTITNKANIELEYDIPVMRNNYPLLNLTKDSYVRVHKQTIVHVASIRDEISDLKSLYENLYLLILTSLEKYNKETLNNAL